MVLSMSLVWRAHLRGGALLAIACAAGFFWTMPAADAKEPGVVYEPGSPSSKEYAIPLEEARRDAGAGRRRGSVHPVRFGIGIPGEDTRTSGAGAGIAPHSSSNGASAGQGTSANGGNSATEAIPRLRELLALAERSQERGGSAAATPPRGSAGSGDGLASPLLWMLGPVLLVLLAGLLLGLLFARQGHTRRRELARAHPDATALRQGQAATSPG